MKKTIKFRDLKPGTFFKRRKNGSICLKDKEDYYVFIEGKQIGRVCCPSYPRGFRVYPVSVKISVKG